MVDLGIYNFVKNALAAGKSKEEITADLSRGGQSAAIIEETFAAVHAGIPPVIKSATPAPVDIGITSRAPDVPVRRIRGVAPIFWLALLILLAGVATVYLRPELSDLKATLQGARQQYETSRVQIPGDSSRPASTQ